MEYKTSKEISELWGITPKRVNVLAKSGKIEGARLIGNTWMIPSEAIKPKDGRYKNSKEVFTYQKFPLLLCSYQNNEQYLSSLNEEEKEFLFAEKLFCQLLLDDAYLIFIKIYQKSKYPSLKIGSLYYLSMYSMMRGKVNDFYSYYRLFNAEISLFSSKHPELICLRYEIESFIVGDKSIVENAKIICEITPNFYSESFISLYVLYFNLSNLVLRKGNNDLCVYEHLCQIIDSKEEIFSSIMAHVYLASMYELLRDKNKAKTHLSVAVRKSFDSKIISVICQTYHYAKNYYEEIMEQYPSEFKENIRLHSEKYITAIKSSSRLIKRNAKKLPLLSDSDFAYIVYLSENLSNKEIAHNLGISESAVSKKYQTIFEKVGVYSKEQFIKKFSYCLANPFAMME